MSAQAETVAIPKTAARRGPAGGIGDAIFHGLTVLFALIVLLVLGGVIVSLVSGGFLAFAQFGFKFFVTSVWNPVTEKFGALRQSTARW